MARHPTKRAAAKAMKRSRQWLDKALAGEASPGPEMCVKLAADECLTPDETLRVLRSAGHDELAADLARAGFGGDLVPTVDRLLLADFYAQATGDQEHWRALLRSSAERLRQSSTSTPSPRPRARGKRRGDGGDTDGDGRRDGPRPGRRR